MELCPTHHQVLTCLLVQNTSKPPAMGLSNIRRGIGWLSHVLPTLGQTLTCLSGILFCPQCFSPLCRGLGEEVQWKGNGWKTRNKKRETFSEYIVEMCLLSIYVFTCLFMYLLPCLILKRYLKQHMIQAPHHYKNRKSEGRREKETKIRERLVFQ